MISTMWAWILGAVGVLGIGGAITAAVIFIPGAAEVALNVLAAVVRAVAATASWCLRQAMAAPAWTGVLATVAFIAWAWSGNIGYGRGHALGLTDGQSIGAADLNQCHGNVGRLESAIKDRNAEILALGKQGEALRADLKAMGAKHQAETEALRARLAALAASKPAGKNECERAASARAQILEDRSR